jgi:hypothetical protein
MLIHGWGNQQIRFSTEAEDYREAMMRADPISQTHKLKADDEVTTAGSIKYIWTFGQFPPLKIFPMQTNKK